MKLSGTYEVVGHLCFQFVLSVDSHYVVLELRLEQVVFELANLRLHMEDLFGNCLINIIEQINGVA